MLLPDKSDPPNAGRFSPGQVLAGRFAVIRYIDGGGMGEVYEVEDRFLQHVHVALKVILPEIAGDARSSHRFEQEVLLARKVVHPNLCPIYDITRCDNPAPPFLFLTMKLLRGETLSVRLKRPEPIPREDAIKIFQQLVAGVAAIHAAGVIHRDIKPNNVMLDTSGPELCISIMDFGLARLHDPEATIATQSQGAGTPGYMAPEIQGAGPSQAADIFALGVVLHQVLTGQRPRFGVFSHSLEPTVALEKANIPPLFIQAVKDFLSNDTNTRCQAFERIRPSLVSETPVATIPAQRRHLVIGTLSFFLLLGGLLLIPAIGERVRGILFSSSEKHIAVLPLESIGGTADTQAIGDGLMDSLAGKLSNLDVTNHALWVVPASEVRARKVTDAVSASREFGATIVVQGRFERTNKLAHLQLVLIDPKRTRQIGYVDVESLSSDLASLEDQAVTRLGRLLNLSLRGEQPHNVDQQSHRAAFEDYLTGIGYLQREDQQGNLQKGIDSLTKAIQTDPHFALAFARLAQAYVMKYRLNTDSQWLKLAGEYSRQAAELDDKAPSTYVALAEVHELTGNRDLAIQEYQRALSLDPQDAAAVIGLAHSLQKEERYSEAEAAYIRATSLRPDDWTGYSEAGIFYQDTGHPHEAIEQFRHALDLTPNNSWVLVNLAYAYIDLGDPALLGAAETALKKSISISPTAGGWADLADLYLQQHRFADAISASKEALLLNDRDTDATVSLTFAYEWLKMSHQADATRATAIQLFEAQIKQNPEDAVAHATLAALYAKNGRSEKAMESIQISLALSPHDRYVFSEVADAYELLGNREESVKYLSLTLAAGLPKSELAADPEIQSVLSDPKFAARAK